MKLRHKIKLELVIKIQNIHLSKIMKKLFDIRDSIGWVFIHID